jgi:glutathione S-transferase
MRVTGIAFELIRIPLDEADTRAAIARHSPTGRVPLLRDGDDSIWESLAICEHVAERQGIDGWPQESAARAYARACAHEMHAGFSAMRNEFPMNCRARGRRLEASPDAAADIQRIGDIWQQLRSRFGGTGQWLCGDFGIVDAMFAPVVMRSLTYGWQLPAEAQAYARAVADSPAMQEWLAAAQAESEVIAREEVGA